MVRTLITTMLFGALASGLVAQEPPTFEVLPGYHDVLSIRYQPRASLDWEALVPLDLASLSVPTTDTSILERFLPLIDQYGSAEVSHTIPIPETLSAGHTYAIGVAGVAELRLDSVRVMTRLRFSYDRTELVGRQSWGEVFGSTAAVRGFFGGGFVVQSTNAMRFESGPSSHTADDILLGSRAVQQSPDGGYAGRGTAFWGIAAQYLISVGDGSEEWLFVRWQPDDELFEVGCKYRYGLFRLGEGEDPPTQISWTSYRCDV